MSIPRLTLAALIDARFPDDYTEHDETRDFRRVLLETDQGRRVLARMIARTGWLTASPPVVNGREVPQATVYDEGRRSVGQMIATILDRDTTQKADDGGRDDDQ